jgi:hypothetical protein
MRRVGAWHIRTSNRVWDIVLEGGQRVSSGYYFPDARWHHYAVSINNINKTITFYVDGKQFGDVHNYTNGFEMQQDLFILVNIVQVTGGMAGLMMLDIIIQI